MDLLYVSDPDSHGSYWELMELREKLAELIGRPVGLVPKDYLHWVIRERVLADARQLYTA